MKWRLLSIVCLVVFKFGNCHSDTKSMDNPNLSTHVVADTIIEPSSTFEFTTDYIMGHFDPTKHPDFTEIPAKYRDNQVRHLRKDVLEAFIKMYDAAEKEGIHLIIKSATRNFDYQKGIWENKWTGKTILSDGINAAKDILGHEERALKILEYSSMPGTSRHHWGTDIDLNNFNNEWFDHGEGKKIYEWLTLNASKYGFCQPYTPIGSDRASGYFEEKWHWSYLPVAHELTQMAKLKLKNEMISGFLGSETAMEVDMLNNYILGISIQCLQE